MHMRVMDAPDIRWAALGQHREESRDDEGSEQEHMDDGEYDFATFSAAVIDGRYNNGEPLGSDMPRWAMSEDDLLDLAAYLESLAAPEM